MFTTDREAELLDSNEMEERNSSFINVRNHQLKREISNLLLEEEGAELLDLQSKCNPT